MSQETTAATVSARSTISGADEMADRIRTANLDALIAALPEAVDRSMRKTWPDEYTPELAAQFAETMAAVLRGQYTAVTEVSA